jgi:hypothetical protein
MANKNIPLVTREEAVCQGFDALEGGETCPAAQSQALSVDF